MFLRCIPYNWTAIRKRVSTNRWYIIAPQSHRDRDRDRDRDLDGDCDRDGDGDGDRDRDRERERDRDRDRDYDKTIQRPASKSKDAW